MSTEHTSNSAAADRPSREERREAAVRREADRPAAVRARPANFGGPRLKLSVIGEIPGYHLYWENDEDGAVDQLLYEGFEFVKPSEVSMQSHIVADKDIADRVSRYVGKKSDGSPLRAYLMKVPDEIWAEREANRYGIADQMDNQIRAGTAGEASGMYKPKGLGIGLDTQFRKAY